jgi:hypothetical protein
MESPATKQVPWPEQETSAQELFPAGVLDPQPIASADIIDTTHHRERIFCPLLIKKGLAPKRDERGTVEARRAPRLSAIA